MFHGCCSISSVGSKYFNSYQQGGSWTDWSTKCLTLYLMQAVNQVLMKKKKKKEKNTIPGFLAGSFENKDFLNRLFLVKYRVFWQIFQQTKVKSKKRFIFSPHFQIPSIKTCHHGKHCHEFTSLHSVFFTTGSSVIVSDCCFVNCRHQ